MYPLPIPPSDVKVYEAALLDPRRQVRFRAQLYKQNGDPLPIPLEIEDGEVTVDASDPRNAPARLAELAVVDTRGTLPIEDGYLGGGTWFAKQLGITWGLYVRDLGTWIDTPIFRGPVYEVERSENGALVVISAASKEYEHLDPHVFHKSYSVPKGVRKHKAIRAVMEFRGETEFSLDPVDTRLAREKAWSVGQSPWRAVQQMADSVDMQLFYQGDGTLRLRPVPDRPAFRFRSGDQAVHLQEPEHRLSRSSLRNFWIVKGERRIIREEKSQSTELNAAVAAAASSFVVKSATGFATGRRVIVGGDGGSGPEERTINSVAGTTIGVSKAFDRKHSKDAPVKVYIQEVKKGRLPVGRAALDRDHPFSSQSLSDGKRPAVKMVERSRIHRQPEAQDKAEALRDRARTALVEELSFSCAPDPRWQELDKGLVEVSGQPREFRAVSFNIPLNLDGAMEFNWHGRRRIKAK